MQSTHACTSQLYRKMRRLAEMSRMCVNMFLLIAAMTALGATDPAMGVDRQQRELSYTYIPSVTAVPPDVVNRCSSFDLASMSKGRTCGSPYASPCFDFSRCLDRATIYVYDPQCTLADSSRLRNRGGLHARYRDACDDAGVLAETYESACIFIHVNRIRETPCATLAPLWNEGANHIMIDMTDWNRDKRPAYSNSYAMEGASSQHSCYYRTGYDISVAQQPKVTFHELQAIAPGDRKYFMTFRGTLYLNKHGFEERASIIPLHDDSAGVIVAEKCCDKCFSTWPASDEDRIPAYKAYCRQALDIHQRYDFEDLMNSTFGLLPAGASPGTHRLAEVMSAGAIPVLVVRDWVRPFEELVDWPSFSFIFSPDQVETIVPTLRAIRPEKLRTMQEKSLQAYWKIYGGVTDYTHIAGLTVQILGQRMMHHRA